MAVAACAVIVFASLGVVPAQASTRSDRSQPAPELVPQVERVGDVRRDDVVSRRPMREFNIAEDAIVWRVPHTDEVLRVVPFAAQSIGDKSGLNYRHTQLEMSGDKRLLASAAGTGETYLQDSWTGQVLHQLDGAYNPVAFSPDGTLLITTLGRSYQKVRGKFGVWSVADGKLFKTLDAGDSDRAPLLQAMLSPDNRRMATYEHSSLWYVRPFTIKVWDVERGKLLQAIPVEKGFLEAIRFLPQSNDLVVVLQLGKVQGTPLRVAAPIWQIKVWDAASGALRYDFQQSYDEGESTSPVFSSPEKLRLSGALHTDATGAASKDQKQAMTVTKEFDLVRGQERVLSQTPLVSKPQLPSGAHKPGGQVPASSLPFGVTVPLETLRVTHRGDVLVADRSRLWNIGAGRVVSSFRGQSHRVSAVAISPDAKMMASGGGDGGGTSSGARLCIWEVPSTRLLWDIRVSLDRSNGIAFSEAGYLWITSLSFSPDGSRLAVGGALKGPPLRVYEARSGKQVWFTAQREGVLATAFSPNGQMIATGEVKSGRKGQAQLWSARSGKLLQTLPHDRYVNAVAFSPDGKMLATSDAVSQWREGTYPQEDVSASTIHFWDVATGKSVKSWTGHKDIVRVNGFFP